MGDIGAVYYEADTIPVEVQVLHDSHRHSVNLVFNPIENEENKVHVAYVNNHEIVFNTEAYLINAEGKTVDHFHQFGKEV